MKAPAGPPIWTLLPPSGEMRSPATTAVTRPAAGVAPDAMAIAMLSGNATIATVAPAAASAANWRSVYPGRVERSFGFTTYESPSHGDAALRRSRPGPGIV